MSLSILPPGSTLVAGQGLVSPGGRYHLDFQSDGNLVLYDSGQGAAPPGVAYWASNTSNIATSGPLLASFTLQNDGQMVIHDAAGQLAWYATPSPVAGSFLVLQDDGNLVLYDANGNAGWNTQQIEAQQTTFLSDLGAAILSIPQGAVDDFVSVIQQIPGVPWLGGQLKDFANTSLGQTFLRAIAGGLSAGALSIADQGALAAAAGPALAQVAIAIPGLAKGDKLSAAYLSEMMWRVSTTAQYFLGMVVQGYTQDLNSASQALSDDLNQATQGVLANLPPIPGLRIPDLSRLGSLTAQGLSSLASRLHVREDSLQSAIDAFSGTHSIAMPAMPAHLLPGNVPVGPQPARTGKTFDPLTGRQILPSVMTTSAFDAWVSFYNGRGTAPLP